MLQRNVCASFVAILALVATPVLAQQPQHEEHHPATAPPAATAGPNAGMPGDATTGAGGMPMMGMMRMMMGQDGMHMMAGHIEGRLAFLKTELKITDAQLPLWNALAQAMRDNATAMRAMPHAMTEIDKAPAFLDKLAARETLLMARLEAVRKLKAAADPLYTALNADQKKTADEIMLGPMGMMM